MGAELPRARVGDGSVCRAGDGTRRHRPPVTLGGARTPRRERGAPRAGCSASFAVSVSTRSSSARATRSRSTESSSRGPSSGDRGEGAPDEPPAPARGRWPRGGVRRRTRARRDARRWRRRRAGAEGRRRHLDVDRAEPALLRRPRHGARGGAREPSGGRPGHGPSGGDALRRSRSSVVRRSRAQTAVRRPRSTRATPCNAWSKRACRSPAGSRSRSCSCTRDRAATTSSRTTTAGRVSTSSRGWRRLRSRPIRRRGGSRSLCPRSRTAWNRGHSPRRSRSPPRCSCSARSRSWCERSHDAAGCCSSGRASGRRSRAHWSSRALRPRVARTTVAERLRSSHACSPSTRTVAGASHPRPRGSRGDDRSRRRQASNRWSTRSRER